MIYRDTKGAPLTSTEIDSNFRESAMWNTFVTPEMYGAMHDGSNDAPAIQAAISSGAREVRLKPGVAYTITDTLYISSSILLTSSNMFATTINYVGNGTAISIDNTSSMAGIVLENFTLARSGTLITGDEIASIGIVANHMTRGCRVSNCKIYNFGTGITLNNSWYSKYYCNSFEGNYVGMIIGTNSNNVTVQDNVFDGSKSMHLHITSAGGQVYQILITGNAFEACLGSCYLEIEAIGTTIDANYFEGYLGTLPVNCNYIWLSSAGTLNTTISNNTFLASDPSFDGAFIFANYGNRLYISGNYCNTPTSLGWFLAVSDPLGQFGIVTLSNNYNHTRGIAGGASHPHLRGDYVGSNTIDPSITPQYKGEIWINTTSKKIWIATGMASVADWTPIN